MKSQISEVKECYICRRFLGVETTENLQSHHFIHGRGLRELADEDGLFADLCLIHHKTLHDSPFHPYDKELKAIAQETYLKTHTREEFIKRYGRFFN